MLNKSEKKNTTEGNTAAITNEADSSSQNTESAMLISVFLSFLKTNRKTTKAPRISSARKYQLINNHLNHCTIRMETNARAIYMTDFEKLK